MKKCECGCGKEVNNNKNSFINGHSIKNKKHSEEHKRKISEALKNRVISKETRTKISVANTGKKRSEETKKKLSEMRKGKPAWNKGKKMGSEWKERVSKNFKGKKHTLEYKNKMRMYAIKRIEKQFLNGEPLVPCIGKTERIFLDKIEIILNLKIHRQFPICGYFIDGYIPKLKLAIEFDEERNHRDKRRDLERQKEIEKYLGCRFFRITDSEWKNNKKEIFNEIRRLKHVIE